MMLTPNPMEVVCAASTVLGIIMISCGIWWAYDIIKNCLRTEWGTISNYAYSHLLIFLGVLFIVSTILVFPW